MNKDKGRFIVIEGLEGAGKSTAINKVKDILLCKSCEVITTHEPGGTGVGDKLRSIIKNGVADEILDARAELLLLYASRVQLLENIIKPALMRGAWVISDRFELSTFAYQGGGRKIACEVINEISKVCLQGFTPDLTLFLDVTPELGLQRARERSDLDRIEQESLDFFKLVHENYHKNIKNMRNVAIIDAAKSIHEVEKQISEVLTKYLDVWSKI